jgi:hypothetical protein
MLFHRIRSSRPGIRVLAGTLLALGVAAGTASAAAAAPVPRAASAHEVPAHADHVLKASEFVAYTGRSFTGTVHVITRCGGHNIPLPLNSWRFFYRGESVKLYNERNEGGAVLVIFHSNEQSPVPAPFKSLVIVC